MLLSPSTPCLPRPRMPKAKNFGDGSLFVANLACRLLVEALDPRAEGGGSGGGGRGDLHATREGFALALTWSLEVSKIN